MGVWRCLVWTLEEVDSGPMRYRRPARDILCFNDELLLRLTWLVGWLVFFFLCCTDTKLNLPRPMLRSLLEVDII